MAELDKPGWRLGSIVGVPVFLAKSWLVIGLVVVALFGPQLSALRPDLGVLAYVVALIYALALLLSVLVHEVSHAVTAKLMGMRPQHIALTLWGGHTQFDADNIRPTSSFVVAFAGPLSNLAIAGVAWLALGSMDPYDISTRLLYGVMWTNGFVGLFNLIPGLPLDGGAMLEAAIWGITGKRSTGTTVAAYLGMAATVVGVLYMMRGFLTGGPRPGTFTIIWTLLIAQMLWLASRSALRTGRFRSKAERIDLRQLTVPALIVAPGDPLTGILQRGMPGSPIVVVDPVTRMPVGIVDGGALAAAANAGRYDATAISVSRGLSENDLIEHDSDAVTILTRLGAQPRPELLVMDRGAIVGILPVDRLIAQLQ